MEKQDILEKSRREKTDEGVAYAENEGRRYGEISFCLLIIAVLVYDFAKGLDNYLPMSLLWAYLAAQALGKYQARGSADSSGGSCSGPSPPCASCSAMCCGPGERGRGFG